MRKISYGLTIAGLAALWLTGCGGGGGSGSSSGGAQNSVPSANAGAPQAVAAGATVTLNGSGSDADGTIASFTWRQLAGTTVTLSNNNVSSPTFTAPMPPTSMLLTFALVVTDNRGARSAESMVNITVAPASNVTPIASAGFDAAVVSGATVTLDASASIDPDGAIASFVWTQASGPAVTLLNSQAVQPSFVAPVVTSPATLTFSLVSIDNFGASSDPSTVVITVNPIPDDHVPVSGRVRFGAVPITAGGLEYAIPGMTSARGVVIQLLNADNQAVVATASSDGFGLYSLAAPANTNLMVRIIAQMTCLQPQTLPCWDVQVRNGVGGTVYSHDSESFNPGDAGATFNVDIPLGISSSGIATGVRASGPFAILDTIYTSMQTVLTAAPAADFPPLIISWGPQSQGTFFFSGSPQYIELLADLTTDTDEFDRHVVAHEFGHYIEHNFSRSDSIGGPHGVGDRLDIRVAFGEGFGYAFAAITLRDSQAYDSFVDNSSGTPVRRSSHFDIEDNPPAPGDPSGCWCSESSVWSILYDIFDANADSGDTLALGFQPIWDVLIGAQVETPAFTSIFSFISALKSEVPERAAAIDDLLSAQNMVTNMDAFGTVETTLPAPLPTNAVFPIYTTAAIGGGPVTLRTVNDAGTANKLGNRRFVVFENAATRNVTITVSTSNTDTNADPDFVVWRAGAFIRAGTQPPPGPEVQTITSLPPGTYLIDVYDCGNGCNPAEGASGDYDLTVTIN